jgi:hypothetical protein
MEGEGVMFHFGGVFQHICLTFYATFRYTEQEKRRLGGHDRCIEVIEGKA